MFNGVAKLLWMEPLYDGDNISTEATHLREIIKASSKHTTSVVSDKAENTTKEHLYMDCPNGDPANTTKEHLYVDCPNGDAMNSRRGHVMETSLCDARAQLMYIRLVLETVANKQESRDARTALEAEIHAEWKYLASVLDRLFFILYLIAIVISLTVFFPRP